MRKTKKAALEQRSEARGLFLFDLDHLPVRPDFVQATSEKRYEHTGVRLTEDEVKCQRIVNRLCLRHGIERIAREEQVSPHSIRGMRELLVAQGKMAGYTKRFVMRVEEILEAGLDKYYEGIVTGKVSPAQLPVGLGILSDKRSLALGEPTAISMGGTAQLGQEHLSVQRLNAFLNSLTADGESIGNPPKPEQISVPPASAPTSAPTSDRPCESVATDPLKSGSEPTKCCPGDRGGGCDEGGE